MIHCGSTSRRVTSCGRPAPPPDTVTEQRSVRAAVAELRRLGCVTEVHVRSLSRLHGQLEPMRPARLTPGTEWAVLHRVRPRRCRVGVRVQATAEFNGDDWRFVVRVDPRGHGCPITRLAGNVSDWFLQAAWHLGDLPGTHAPGSAGLSVLTSVAQLGSHGEEHQAYAALAELVTGDDRARWSSELVNGALVYRGDYGTTDVGSTTHRGHRTVMFTSAAFALGEQYDADGAAVWRHAGTLAEIAARLQALPRPGEKGAPTRALSHARAFSRDPAVNRPPHSIWRHLDG